MKNPSTKLNAVPAEETGSDAPTYRFKSFTWAPDDLPRNAMVHAQELSQLVNHVKDVANGAATVFQLILAHEQEIAGDNATYLSPCSLGLLQQMAMRSLQSLDVEADNIVDRLRSLTRSGA